MWSSYEPKRPELKPIISNFGNDVKGKTGTLVSPQTGRPFLGRHVAPPGNNPG